MSKLRAEWRTGQDLPIPPGRPRRAVRRAGQVLAEALPRCANVASDFISWASASSSVEWEHGLDPRPVVVGGVNGMRNGKGLLRSVPGRSCVMSAAALTMWLPLKASPSGPCCRGLHCFLAELNQVAVAVAVTMSDWATKDSPHPHWGWSQRAVGTSRWALSCPRPTHLCPGSSCGLCAILCPTLPVQFAFCTLRARASPSPCGGSWGAA